MHYFEAFYGGIVVSPSIKTIKRIVITGVPSMNGFGRTNGCTPFFEIYSVQGLINKLYYDNRDSTDIRFHKKDEGAIWIKP